MSARKTLTDHRLEEMVEMNDRMRADARKTWEIGKENMAVKSLGFIAICRTGRAIERSRDELRVVACRQAWSNDKLASVFGTSDALVYV